MKLIKLTTENGTAIKLNSEEIGLLVPSKRSGCKTAIYEMFSEYLEDLESGFEDHYQSQAIHVRESMDFIEDSANSLYHNKTKTFHPAI